MLDLVTRAPNFWMMWIISNIVILIMIIMTNHCKLISCHDCLFSKKEDTIHIGCVICGNRLEQASIMLKSILMFTKQQPVLHVVAEDALQQGLVNRLSEWQAVLGNHIHFKLYSLQFPDESWKTLFKPCASQRLFLPVSTEHKQGPRRGEGKLRKLKMKITVAWRYDFYFHVV